MTTCVRQYNTYPLSFSRTYIKDSTKDCEKLIYIQGGHLIKTHRWPRLDGICKLCIDLSITKGCFRPAIQGCWSSINLASSPYIVSHPLPRSPIAYSRPHITDCWPGPSRILATPLVHASSKDAGVYSRFQQE